MFSKSSRWAVCTLVACYISFLGCSSASEKELTEARRQAEQATADNGPLRKELLDALRRNNQLTEQLQAANEEAERQREARAEAERLQATAEEQLEAALTQSERDRDALAEAESKPQTQTVYRPQLPEVKFSPQITLPASPPRKAVDIYIHSVNVYDTKDGSKVWDESGPPDLKVKITNLDNRDSYCTSTSQDTESADFNRKAIRVYEGQTIEIEVLDGDVFADDTIGSLVKEVTADTMASGKVDWSFDRVSSLVIEFQP